MLRAVEYIVAEAISVQGERDAVRFAQHFFTSEKVEATHSWTLARHSDTSSNVDDLAHLLAELIMGHRCRGCPQYYRMWKQRLDGGKGLSSPAAEALSAFIKPVFGLPENPDSVDRDHMEGYVAEYLWYFLSLDGLAGGNIVRIEPPGFTATDPGGDGLIIHHHASANLMFRLWEIKKCTGDSKVSHTVGNAYRQLDAKATEYLARYTAIGQEIADTALSDFYGQLVDLWIDAKPEAAAGVSVATSLARCPNRCFTTFGKNFPRFTDPIRLRGMLTAIADFPKFANKVREYIWTGLLPQN